MALALRVLNWTNAKIIYKPTNPIKSPLDLIKGGKGTCGVQAKVFGSLMRAYGFPIRYLTSYTKDKKNTHDIVEAYVDNKWVFFDPQHNLFLFDINNKPLSTWEIKNNKDISSKHPLGKEIFDIILIYEDNSYHKLNNINSKWFYSID